ncbi:MAG: hypothetical protein ACE5GD_10540 [Candidatus Geothermarchaeales archaeon]
MSTLLMIIAFVSIGGAAYISSQMIMQSEYNLYKMNVDVKVDSMSERFVIVDVWFHGTEVTIGVYNYGSLPLEVDAVYVDDALVERGLGVEVDVYGTASFSVDYSYVSGQVYQVKVVSVRGSAYEVSARA